MHPGCCLLGIVPPRVQGAGRRGVATWGSLDHSPHTDHDQAVLTRQSTIKIVKYCGYDSACTEFKLCFKGQCYQKRYLGTIAAALCAAGRFQSLPATH